MRGRLTTATLGVQECGGLRRREAETVEDDSHGEFPYILNCLLVIYILGSISRAKKKTGRREGGKECAQILGIQPETRWPLV